MAINPIIPKTTGINHSIVAKIYQNSTNMSIYLMIQPLLDYSFQKKLLRN